MRPSRSQFQVACVGATYFATLYGVGLHQRSTVYQEIFWYVVQRHVRLHPKVHVSRGEIVNMKPDVFGMPILDKILILVFVLAHIQRVCTTSARKVKDHSQRGGASKRQLY